MRSGWNVPLLLLIAGTFIFYTAVIGGALFLIHLPR